MRTTETNAIRNDSIKAECPSFQIRCKLPLRRLPMIFEIKKIDRDRNGMESDVCQMSTRLCDLCENFMKFWIASFSCR